MSCNHFRGGWLLFCHPKYLTALYQPLWATQKKLVITLWWIIWGSSISQLIRLWLCAIIKSTSGRGWFKAAWYISVIEELLKKGVQGRKRFITIGPKGRNALYHNTSVFLSISNWSNPKKGVKYKVLYLLIRKFKKNKSKSFPNSTTVLDFPFPTPKIGVTLYTQKWIRGLTICCLSKSLSTPTFS